ncbi:uncharacterized protein LOC119319518 [Triticum dicoccoides]|uniref:uncharacterized protein LOC119319518 n=1 Tax=Triticum dicoccoides TaxID=85692 RepID=UPI001890F197|nr:uncharacterized protein LOC119319518 [Triticum dicoccoides]
MCAFQAKGQGFFYIPDSCTAKQLKERSTSVVITVIEGEASVKELEEAFSDYIGTKWHCTARTIGPNTYVMRFPNQRDVKKACYNDRMILKYCGVVVKIVPWSANIGAKGAMEMAWVKVANIPMERRNERNVAYVSSLVGVPLEIDMATLHKPEFVRVRLCCRNVDELPGVVEAVLGTHFFDFFYEIEKVLVRDLEREKKVVQMEADAKKSPYVRTSTWGKHDPKSGYKGKNEGCSKNGGDGDDDPVDAKEEESVESDESEHNTLLIETMVVEAYNKEKT